MLRQRARPARGFTLLEMIVTMSIFAILVAVGVPTLRKWISNVKVRAVADSLQNGLRLAQSESLRRSRQVVFSLTSSTTPQTPPVAAATTGNSWAAFTIPSMTDGSETNSSNAFIDSGALGAGTSSVTVTGQQAAICFNSVGRLVTNTTAGVTAVTGGATCGQLPSNPAVWSYNVTLAGADHPLRVQVSLAGQVHLCDPSRTLSNSNPDGC